MDKQFKVKLLPIAKDDLRSIVQYIAIQGFAPMAAIKMEHDILDVINSLASWPYYRIIDKKRGIRICTVIKPYVILFKTYEDKNIVRVRRIFHGRRNWQDLPW